MKKILLGYGLVFFSFILITSCGGSSDGNNFFYSSAKQVAPAITATVASAVKANTLTTGSILDKVYQMLRDYENPRDEGVIDMQNIYKVLWEAGQQYTYAEGNCTSITEATVASPFDMGLNTVTYNCAGNSGNMSDDYAKGYAIKTLGFVKYGLMTFRWAPPSDSFQESHGVLQGDYNEDTKDLNIRMLNHVQYTGTDGFVIRTHISGNELTHAFSISMISSNLTLSSYISMVGTGVSRGAGHYFLFKTNAGKYFCVKADATENDLAAIDAATPNGTDIVDPNCAIYEETVNGIDFLTPDDVPANISNFTNSSILLTY